MTIIKRRLAAVCKFNIFAAARGLIIVITRLEPSDGGDFKTIATPNFYLIDKDGTIVKGFNGFSDELEAELTKLIDSKIQ